MGFYGRKQREYRRRVLLKAVLQTTAAALEIVSELGVSDTESEGEGAVQRVRQKRSCWARSWLQRRNMYGQYEILLGELREEDPRGFKIFQRLTPEIWNELYTKVAPRIERTTCMRGPISAGCRLAVTLRYLATGDNYQSEMFNFRVASNTICGIVPDTCSAIFESLKPDYFEVCKIFLIKNDLCYHLKN